MEANRTGEIRAPAGVGAPVRLVRAANEFEAQMMRELIRPLTENGGDEACSGGGLAQFAGEVLGQSLSRAGGFGIADRIVSSLSQTQTDCRSSSVKAACMNSGLVASSNGRDRR